MDFDFNTNLARYYEDMFPLQLIYNWLNYKDSNRKDSFKFREFSFTLQGDIYQRFLAFESAWALRQALLAKNPIKIDVGAVYNISPRQGRAFPLDFKPLEHELVFDIDISDYDDVRNCCEGSAICMNCWPFMKIGAKILKKVLTEEFGFTKLLFVYSGRRGFHCWVCDKAARELTTEARRAIADYFSVVTGGQSVVKRVTLNPLNGIHPMLIKALNVIDVDFEDLMVAKQNFLSDDSRVQNILDLCEDDKMLQQNLADRCKFNHSTSAEKWKLMVATSQKHKGRRGRGNYFIQEVKLQYCFPRLDSNVTRGLNHLLKLPFCIHPKTGNVCVPIDIDNIDSFDLAKVPTLKDKNFCKESMDPYIKILKNFIDSLDD